MRDPVGQLLRDGARAGHDLLRIVADLLRREAELVEIVQQMMDLRGAQQRLGRDAAPIEADAAEMLALYEPRLHPELRRPYRRDIAAGSPADHHKVERAFGHSAPLRNARGM